MTSEKINIGIDASRNKSGGAKAHIIGILSELKNPLTYGFDEVHVWTHKELLTQLPKKPWLKVHTPEVLNKSILHQLLWQLKTLPKSLKNNNCKLLLSTSAGSVCKFKKNIVMSRDMLSFEKGEMQRYSIFSKQRLRLEVLKQVQIKSLKNALGTIFLSNYASKTLQTYTGKLRNTKVIAHGVSENFRRKPMPSQKKSSSDPFICTYVSNADLYKHQWHVVNAFSKINKNYNAKLQLIGGAKGHPEYLLKKSIFNYDPTYTFVKLIQNIKHTEVPQHLFETDIFIFASSCENLPNTLIEAMAAGLPIACSDRGPMPEVLKDAGVYFNPEDPESIEKAVIQLMTNVNVRSSLSARAEEYSQLYSWKKCADQTFLFLQSCLKYN